LQFIIFVKLATTDRFDDDCGERQQVPTTILCRGTTAFVVVVGYFCYSQSLKNPLTMVVSIIQNLRTALKFRGGWKGLLENMYTVRTILSLSQHSVRVIAFHNDHGDPNLYLFF